MFFYCINGFMEVYSMENRINIDMNNSLNGRYDEDIYNKIELIVDSFENIHMLDKREFLQKVFESAFQLIPEAEKGSFYEADGDVFKPLLCRGYDFDTLKKLSFNKKEMFIGFECGINKNIQAYEAYIGERESSNFSQETIDIFKKLGTYEKFTTLYAPIQVEGENIGMICLENFNDDGFRNISKKLLKYYAQLISQFYSQLVYRERKTKLYEDIVKALVSAIEVKDIYTKGHGQRVREYSCIIASKMGLSNEQIENISIAALLHDIGKIGMPTEILNKPGSLTQNEYDIIKLHPEYSKRILQQVSGFSQIVDITYAHHERYDGLGYPLGLKNGEIPIEAQILQLADAFDAMTSERAYRKAMTKEKAVEIIKSEVGKQFNPEIVNVAVDELFNKEL